VVRAPVPFARAVTPSAAWLPMPAAPSPLLAVSGIAWPAACSARCLSSRWIPGPTAKSC